VTTVNVTNRTIRYNEREWPLAGGVVAGMRLQMRVDGIVAPDTPVDDPDKAFFLGVADGNGGVYRSGRRTEALGWDVRRAVR